MSDNPESPAPIDAELLDILVCPLTRSPLRQEGGWLVAQRPAGAGLRYPVRDGVPVLLIDEATLPEGVEDLDAFRGRYADDIPA
ncbi:MAG: Trm112 family protein [Planctomycetota bacterium]